MLIDNSNFSIYFAFMENGRERLDTTPPTTMGPDGWRYLDGTPVLPERAAADAIEEAQRQVQLASAALGVLASLHRLSRPWDK